MLPSFYIAAAKGRAWSVPYAAALGGGIGLAASLFKVLGPLHGVLGGGLVTNLPQIAGATLGFAALCAAAAALRNLIARRLIWPDL